MMDMSIGQAAGRRGVPQRLPQAIVATALLIVIALAVVPLGSNRPFLWTLWPLVLGVVAVVYAGTLLILRRPFRVSLSASRVIAVSYGLICIALVLQLLPFGDFYWGGGIPTQSGLAVHPPFISTTPGDTVLMLLRWSGYGLMFFLTMQVASNPDRRLRLLRSLAVIISVHAAIALLSFYQWGNTILGVERWAYLDSVSGTFVNRNSFATFMAMGLTITTALLIRSFNANQGSARLTGVATYLLCLLFQIAAVLGTNSRMGLFVSVLGPAVVLVVFLHAAGRWRAIVGVLALGLVVAVAATFFSSGVWTRFFAVEQSWQVRLQLYGQVWEMITHAPWLGYGGGSFEQVYPLFHRPPVYTEAVWDRAHNTYLSLWVELGLIAGSLPLVILLRVTAKVIRRPRSADRLDPAPAIWLGIVAVAAVHSAVDFSFEMFAIALLFTALAGIATAASLGSRSGRGADLPQ